MTTYFFYPHSAGGSAYMFEAHELACDAEALRRAEAVLLDHISAVVVAVWDGDRQIGKSSRQMAYGQQIVDGHPIHEAFQR